MKILTFYKLIRFFLIYSLCYFTNVNSLIGQEESHVNQITKTNRITIEKKLQELEKLKPGTSVNFTQKPLDQFTSGELCNLSYTINSEIQKIKNKINEDIYKENTYKDINKVLLTANKEKIERNQKNKKEIVASHTIQQTPKFSNKEKESIYQSIYYPKKKTSNQQESDQSKKENIITTQNSKIQEESSTNTIQHFEERLKKLNSIANNETFNPNEKTKEIDRVKEGLDDTTKYPLPVITPLSIPLRKLIHETTKLINKKEQQSIIIPPTNSQVHNFYRQAGIMPSPSSKKDTQQNKDKEKKQEIKMIDCKSIYLPNNDFSKKKSNAREDNELDKLIESIQDNNEDKTCKEKEANYKKNFSECLSTLRKNKMSHWLLSLSYNQETDMIVCRKTRDSYWSIEENTFQSFLIKILRKFLTYIFISIRECTWLCTEIDKEVKNMKEILIQEPSSEWISTNILGLFSYQFYHYEQKYLAYRHIEKIVNALLDAKECVLRMKNDLEQYDLTKKYNLKIELGDIELTNLLTKKPDILNSFNKIFCEVVVKNREKINHIYSLLKKLNFDFFTQTLPDIRQIMEDDTNFPNPRFNTTNFAYKLKYSFFEPKEEIFSIINGFCWSIKNKIPDFFYQNTLTKNNRANDILLKIYTYIFSGSTEEEQNKKYESVKNSLSRIKKDYISNPTIETLIEKIININPIKNNCIICFAKFNIANQPTPTKCKCNSIYHKICLESWLKQKPTCPTCRTTL